MSELVPTTTNAPDTLITAIDFGPRTPAVEQVLAQVRRADPLTFALAAVPVLPSGHRDERQRHATVTAWHAARDHDRAAAWGAAWAACSLITEHPAAIDSAVAEVVKDLVTAQVYLALTAPWQAAVTVREELRRLGPQAEYLAASLLDLGWTNDVRDIPDVARGTLAA
jgi:CO/xanthine dehydrogenase FAD-binding subunit